MSNIKLLNGSEIPAIGFGPGSFIPKYVYKKDAGILYKIKSRLHRELIDKKNYINGIVESINNGFRLIDYSAAYGDGKLIAEAICKSGVERRSLILTTRISNSAQFQHTVKEEVFTQLEGFGTDYFDILMLHWPVTGLYENTWKEMIELRNKGYCRTLGVANCNIHHLKRLFEISGEYPEINQFEVHPLFTQVELRDFCKKQNIQVESYTPTARQDSRLMQRPFLQDIAHKYKKNPTQIILRWHIQNNMVPIVRSNNPQHIKNNSDVFDFELTEKELKEIDLLNINSRLRYDPDNCDFTML